MIYDCRCGHSSDQTAAFPGERCRVIQKNVTSFLCPWKGYEFQVYIRLEQILTNAVLFNQ